MAVIKYPFQSQMYSPWRDIDEILSNRLTRFVEDVPNRREGNGMWSPQIGVTETKDEVILTAELPGISEKDVNIELEKNVLVISGEKTVERKEGEELIPMRDFRKELKGKMEHLRMDVEFARRYVNDGFSGGEMKRAEILQLAMLQPKFAVLDETDSGLDADAVRLASESIADIGRAKMGLLIITHHDKLLEHNPPDVTHVILGGRIVEKGGPELAVELYQHGYDRIRAQYPEAEAQNQQMIQQEETV